MNTIRFSIYDNGDTTADRYTLIDKQSADIMNGETYMQCTSFSVNFDSPLGVISHDVIYPEDLHLLGKEIDSTENYEKIKDAVHKIIKAYYS